MNNNLVYLWTEAKSADLSLDSFVKPLPSSGAQSVMGRRKARLFPSLLALAVRVMKMTWGRVSLTPTSL